MPFFFFFPLSESYFSEGHLSEEYQKQWALHSAKFPGYCFFLGLMNSALKWHCRSLNYRLEERALSHTFRTFRAMTLVRAQFIRVSLIKATGWGGLHISTWGSTLRLARWWAGERELQSAGVQGIIMAHQDWRRPLGGSSLCHGTLEIPGSWEGTHQPSSYSSFNWDQN